ncbi:hypothetical protein SDRG_03355 [Saprolegnia diclina VS20]|uniref:Uncharacterized protein n=1 Tax=Saprolegnia diclina (strain VS20) TaxID=1156394 RepID=T0QM45_SAPDV|nr:hypothetical protein SDRG_03355 [Saprolegnia diclina VS20]EQC39149.1 hypothetical protein SDRG_03355 [Saprolegnia diclina VS20]|eukprot:XP_008607210.1 hypothetical protein SDRG_03355 [Saprolegnia diclina VS20]
MASAGIADHMHMMAELQRLKAQVVDVATVNKSLLETTRSIEAELSSFATLSQLDAGLSLKASTTMVPTQLDELKQFVLQVLSSKTDLSLLDVLLPKKLDTSVFEASQRQHTKEYARFEDTVRTLFTSFVADVQSHVQEIATGIAAHEVTVAGHAQRVEATKDHLSTLDIRLRRLEAVCGVDPTAARISPSATLPAMAAACASLEAAQATQIALVSDLREALETTQSQVGALEAVATGTKRDMSRNIANEIARLQEADAHGLRQLEKKIITLVESVDAVKELAQSAQNDVHAFQNAAATSVLDTYDRRVAGSIEALHADNQGLRDAFHKHHTTLAAQSRSIEDSVRAHDTSLCSVEHQLRQLAAHCRAIERELAALKGPFITEVRNLKQENFVILDEIRRQQDISRELVLDYKDAVGASGPTRPSTLPPTHVLPTTSANKARAKTSRPQTCGPPVNCAKRFGVVHSAREPRERERARTAGAKPSPRSDGPIVLPPTRTNQATQFLASIENVDIEKQHAHADGDEDDDEDPAFEFGRTSPRENGFLVRDLPHRVPRRPQSSHDY